MTSATASTPPVFIVDDDASMRSAMQRLLKAVGLHTETIEALSNLFKPAAKGYPTFNRLAVAE